MMRVWINPVYILSKTTSSELKYMLLSYDFQKELAFIGLSY